MAIEIGSPEKSGKTVSLSGEIRERERRVKAGETEEKRGN